MNCVTGFRRLSQAGETAQLTDGGLTTRVRSRSLTIE